MASTLGQIFSIGEYFQLQWALQLLLGPSSKLGRSVQYLKEHSRSLSIYRNSDKKESLDTDSLVVLVLKIVFDSASRIVLFSCWLYIYNEGQFSTWIVFIAYYLVVSLLFIFNLIFNDTRDFSSLTYWIGIILKYHRNSKISTF